MQGDLSLTLTLTLTLAIIDYACVVPVRSMSPPVRDTDGGALSEERRVLMEMEKLQMQMIHSLHLLHNSLKDAQTSKCTCTESPTIQ